MLVLPYLFSLSPKSAMLFIQSLCRWAQRWGTCHHSSLLKISELWDPGVSRGALASMMVSPQQATYSLTAFSLTPGPFL